MIDIALCKTGGILSTSFTLTTVVRSTPKTVKSLIKSLYCRYIAGKFLNEIEVQVRSNNRIRFYNLS